MFICRGATVPCIFVFLVQALCISFADRALCFFGRWVTKEQFLKMQDTYDNEAQGPRGQGSKYSLFLVCLGKTAVFSWQIPPLFGEFHLDAKGNERDTSTLVQSHMSQGMRGSLCL